MCPADMARLLLFGKSMLFNAERELLYSGGHQYVLMISLSLSFILSPCILKSQHKNKFDWNDWHSGLKLPVLMQITEITYFHLNVLWTNYHVKLVENMFAMPWSWIWFPGSTHSGKIYLLDSLKLRWIKVSAKCVNS